jgi:hypothetical protein
LTVKLPAEDSAKGLLHVGDIEGKEGLSLINLLDDLIDGM